MALVPPFAAGTGLLQNVLHNEPAPLPGVYTKGLRDVVGIMLRKDPDARPSCRELRHDPYVHAAIATWMRVSCNGTVVPSDSGSWLNVENNANR